MQLAGTRPCDIQIQGLDKAAPLLPGGMDGAYKLATCANGRPLYKRITTDKAGDQQTSILPDHGISAFVRNTAVVQTQSIAVPQLQTKTILCISTAQAGVTCMIISVCISGNNTTQHNTTHTEAAKHFLQQWLQAQHVA